MKGEGEEGVKEGEQIRDVMRERAGEGGSRERSGGVANGSLKGTGAWIKGWHGHKVKVNGERE